MQRIMLCARIRSHTGLCLTGGGGGGLGSKSCVSKMGQQDFPYCKFRFPPLWSLWSGGGGSRAKKQQILSYRMPPCHRRPVTNVLLHCSTSKAVLNVALSSPGGYQMFCRPVWVGSSLPRNPVMHACTAGRTPPGVEHPASTRQCKITSHQALPGPSSASRRKSDAPPVTTRRRWRGTLLLQGWQGSILSFRGGVLLAKKI